MPLLKKAISYLAGALCFGVFLPAALAQTEPIRIGLITVKTGPLAGPGRQMEDGMRYFLKERNYTLAGRKVELVVADTAGQPATARNKAQELVERNKVDVLVGPFAATEMLAIRDYPGEAKVPLIVNNALAEDLTQRMHSPWILRATGTSGQLMHPLGEYTVKTLGYKRVALIATDFAYGHEAMGAFQRVLEENGGRVVQKIWVPPTASDFAGYISQIKTDVDAVVASFSGSSATGFMRQYSEFGLKGKLPLVVSHSTVDEPLLPEEGEGAVGVISSGMNSAALDTPANKAFVAGYRKETGADPGYSAVGSYVAGLFLESALKTTGGKTADRQALAKALRSAKLASSPRGPLQVDDYGNPVGEIYIRKVERINGKLQNTVIKTYPNQTQFWTYDTKQFLAAPVYARDWPQSKFLEK